MTALNQQIVTAFEVNGMTPEEIAESFDLEIGAVKAALMQTSAEYRKNVRTELKSGIEAENIKYAFTDDEAEDARSIIINIMRYSTDENLQARMARYVIDDKKGRLDALKNMPQMNFNVLMVNDQMRKAIAARERTAQMKQIKSANTVEVEESSATTKVPI